MTTFQWIRREFAHQFGTSEYPNWGFLDMVGVPAGWNVLRVILRANTYGDLYTGIPQTDWAPAAGQVSHQLGVYRRSSEETRLATVPVPFQPTYVREQNDTPPKTFRANWAAPPVHVDIEARRTASPDGSADLDIGYGAVYVLGPLASNPPDIIYPDVGLWAYVDVLASLPTA